MSNGSKEYSMAFSGWENVQEGEEFPIEEITAFYGSAGPYSLLDRPQLSLWGRYPLMVRAVALQGVEGLFEPGQHVRLFLRQKEKSYDIVAFPEDTFAQKETLRPFLDMAEEKAMQDSSPSEAEPWSDMFSVQAYHMPYCDALQKLEPPYSEDQMEELYRKFAEEYAEYDQKYALMSGLYKTGAEHFSAFCFALAKEGMAMPDGSCYFARWDVVLLFFAMKEDGEFSSVAAVPLRFVNMYHAEKLKVFAEALKKNMSV
jgi:hypothetical protein